MLFFVYGTNPPLQTALLSELGTMGHTALANALGCAGIGISGFRVLGFRGFRVLGFGVSGLGFRV